MRLSSKTLPEHVRLLMPGAERKALGVVTMPEVEARAAAKLEREIQNGIANYLRLHRVPFFQQRMDKKTRGVIGWPDFTLVVSGRACFLECKMPGKKPDPEQEKILAELANAGAFVRVVHSLAEAIEVIREVV